MIPKEILAKSKEGGWKPEKYRERIHYRTGGKQTRGYTLSTSASITPHEIALDPTFWQSLGKALGWDKEPMDINGKCEHCGVDVNYQPSFSSGCNHAHYPEACSVCSKNKHEWKKIPHRFYDLVLNGSSTEEFWSQLLSSKEK